MPVVVRLRAENSPELLMEVAEAAREAGLHPTHAARMREGPLPVELIIALGSAGAFTALFQIISGVLQRNRDRELTIGREGMTLTLKGHSLPEEEELIATLAPELIKKQVKVEGSRSRKGTAAGSGGRARRKKRYRR